MPPPWLLSPSANFTSPKLTSFPLNSEPISYLDLVVARRRRAQRSGFVTTNCTSNPGNTSPQSGKAELNIGSPIVIIEAPPALKTATPMPSLRANTGQVKTGDVGRVVARKPKDVWAVRLAIGTYLLDAKYFRPFDEQE